MPLNALVLYLQGKYKHESEEIIYRIYSSDMLRLMVFGHLEEDKRPIRYWDLINNKNDSKETQRHEILKKDYDPDDIISLFENAGQ